MRQVERRIDDDERAGEDSLERIRAILTEFLGHYAGTINQLDKDERVTVLYRPQTHRFPALYDLKADAKNIDIDVEVITGAFQTGGLGVGIAARVDSIVHKQLATANIDAEVDSLIRHVRRKAGSEDVRVIVNRIANGPHADPVALPLVEATVKKSAIDAFRRGRIDSAKFRQRINFSERERTGSKKIDIMAGILDQSVDQSDHLPFGHTQRTLGMYQPNLGALFFVSVPMPFAQFGPDFARTPRDDADYLNALKDQLVEVVADYGPTLRQVKSDEYVTVEFRSGGVPLFQDPAQRLLLKVSKSAIEAYSRGDMDLAAFRKKAVWQTL